MGLMSITVCLRPTNTLSYLNGGGHFWVFLNWACGLAALGCRVIWLEEVPPDLSDAEARARVATLKSYLRPHGLADGLALCSAGGEALPPGISDGCLDLDAAAGADLLLNMRYDLPAEVVKRFRRSALVDIDPGLLQVWMSVGLIRAAPHDLYFTIGETVGRPGALFPDCGLEWHYVRPPVALPAWPITPSAPGAPYTTVSQWWGEWIEVRGESFDNSKRAGFLDCLDLPARSPAPLELALCLGRTDGEERRSLEEKGWKIRSAWDELPTPEQYRAYVRGSRGEFSCAKPSCGRLQNAWISDRSLCYLASGKPAVVRHTGPSRFLPDAEGLFRFRTPDEAVRALATAETDYERHCRLARDLVEEYFDARKVLGGLLERALA
jgi:hypothetical protein